MKGINIPGLLIFALFLQACTSSNQQPNYDTSLYSGKPIDTLTQDPPPESEVEALQRGDRALSTNNVDLALYEYIRSLSFTPSQYKDKTLYTIGRIHLSRGNTELAEDAFLMSVKINPDGEKALEQLGNLYALSGSTTEAKTYFFRAINADQIRLGSSKGLDYDNINISSAEKLLLDRESPMKAYMGVGILSDIDGNYDLARVFYEKVAQIKPDSAKLLLNQGYSYYMSGEYQLASVYTQRALKIEPDNVKAQNNMALIFLSLGQENKALNMFSRHLERPEALNNVGYFLMLKGYPDKAVSYFQQAIDTKPSYYKLANDNLERALSEIRETDVILSNN